MLHVIVEARAVGLLLEVGLNLALVGFDVLVSHLRQGGVSLGHLLECLLVEDGLISLVIGDHGLLGLEMLSCGNRPTRSLDFLANCVGSALNADWDLIETTENLKRDVLIKHSEILGFIRQVDGVLSAWHELTLPRNRTEVGDLGEVEVKSEIQVFVADAESHVASFILGAFTELEVLAVNLDVRLAGTSHHLNLQVVVHDRLSLVGLEFHHSQGGEIFSFLVSESAFRLRIGRVGLALSILSNVRESFFLFKFLRTADEVDRQLLVRTNGTAERLYSENALFKLLTDSGG